MGMARGQHLIGKVLGSCKLERLLGYGGSSAVFLAQQHNPDRKVAVKVFLPRSNMDVQMQREFYERFLREAKAASQLDHPHILPIYSYGEQEGLPYIVMPYMPGGTLSDYSAKQGALPLKETLWYLEQIAAALDYAHQHGCVHCDVKPANILLDSDGRVMLSDFGIARVTQNDADGQPVAKNPESLMGTPDYISPEQALGQVLDGRSDVYSLGITLFYLLARRLPFKADSTIALALLHIHETPPSLCLVRPDISAMVDRVVRKALAKKADERFQTAGELSKAFAQAIETSEQVHMMPTKRTVLAGNPGLPAPLAVISKPVVRVKPVVRPWGMPRLVMVIGLLLLTVSGTILAGGVIISHFAAGNGGPPPSALSTDIGGANVDYLSQHDNWPSSSTFFYDAASQQYHIQNKSVSNVALALYSNHVFTDFHLSVTMNEVSSLSQDGDYYGVVFRCAADQSRYYLFEVVTSGNEVATAGSGQYAFLRYDGNGQWDPLGSAYLSSLNTKPGQSNTVTVDAKSNSFTFSVNGKLIGPAFKDTSKSALTSGLAGLYVEERGAEVAFSHFYISSAHK